MSAAGLGVAAIALLDGCSGGSSSGPGVAAPGGGGGGAVSPAGPFPLAIQGNSNNDKVLNFALTLEFLEANLYLQALNLAYGLASNTPLKANPSSYNGLPAVPGGGLSGGAYTAGLLYLVEFAYVEQAHATFLQTVLGADAVKPAKSYKFATQPAANLLSILKAIIPLEETGVRAYLGAAPYLTDLATVQTASTIYSTEARHSSALNYIVGNDPGPAPEPGDMLVTAPAPYPHPNTFEYYLTPAQVLTRVTPMIVS